MTPSSLQGFLVEEGCVHGRFQPFHMEHLEYACQAKRHCTFLWIGITQYDLEELDTSRSEIHRQQRAANPLTYIERVRCISAALLEAGMAKKEFAFTPFPIDSPQKLPQFVSKDVHCFTTICEPWNKTKIERMRLAGYEVTVLWERNQKQYSGTEIRRLISQGSDQWRVMVPRSVAGVIDELNLQARLQ